MMGGLRKLELIDILTMMQFKTSMTEVFEDWNPIQQYMKEKLKLNQETIAVISRLRYASDIKNFPLTADKISEITLKYNYR